MRRRNRGLLVKNHQRARIGQTLPTLPLWLADNLAVAVELEGSYEETCKVLRIA